MAGLEDDRDVDIDAARCAVLALHWQVNVIKPETGHPAFDKGVGYSTDRATGNGTLINTVRVAISAS